MEAMKRLSRRWNDTFLAVTSKGVKYQSLSTKYWKDRYVGAKRVLKE